MLTLDEIWEGDLFNRRTEAEQLIGFLETVTMRPSLREDGHAFVLAVDSPYGEGKTFFLRRFAKHMAQSHPVAFVDAWTDDLEDEPLVALAATLDDALSPLADKSGELKKKIQTFKSKATAVGKIVSVGLLKRAASLLIMESGAEAAHAVMADSSDLTKDLGKEVLKDAADEAVAGAVDGATAIVTRTMDERIKRFREGRRAIEDMKTALRAIIDHIAKEETYPPPIVIVVDELDRCRPTYAIKLLEEIKHLFDVEGVAFVLGTHGRALAHSVSAAYGAKFDGEGYLRRFFNRTYQLADVELSPLLAWLFQERGLDMGRLRTPSVRLHNRAQLGRDPARLVAAYMKLYGFNARDAFAVADAIETCLALTGRAVLYLPLLLPLLLAHLRNLSEPQHPQQPADWALIEPDELGKTVDDLGPHQFAGQLAQLIGQSDNELVRAANANNASLAVQVIANLTFGGENQGNELGKPRGYPQLLRTVDRFKSGQPPTA